MAQTVLVTGANRGLGLAFAQVYAQRGDKVIATVRDVHAAPAELRNIARVLPLEVTDDASITRLVAELKGQALDVLVNNAGVMGDDPKLGQLSFTTFARVFAANTYAPAILTQALLSNLREGAGKLVLNISSELGSIDHATPGFSYAYNASKAALNMVSARLAKDLSGDRIVVASFCPGWNKTDMGGAQAPLDPLDSITRLVAVGSKLTLAQSGGYYRIDGSTIPW
jgi:NAD(P)-dependent dehydrogenase (short-subunit alcohol dehydrogenase family)